VARGPLLGIVLTAAALLGCGKDSSGPSAATRSYVMGFSAIPPRSDTALVLPTLTLSAQHSDAGLIQLSIPWAPLIAGLATPAEEVRIVRLPLADYYRNTGHRVTVALDALMA
jgi:hypothetical protein